MPSTFDLLSDEWMFDGHGVSFPSYNEVVLHSDTPGSDQFGVVLTTHAFNDADVDFAVNYTQTDYSDVQSGYESQVS